MRDDWMLQGDEECTVEVYIGWMRKYRAWCEPQVLGTSTMGAANAYLVEPPGSSSGTVVWRAEGSKRDPDSWQSRRVTSMLDAADHSPTIDPLRSTSWPNPRTGHSERLTSVRLTRRRRASVSSVSKDAMAAIGCQRRTLDEWELIRGREQLDECRISISSHAVRSRRDHRHRLNGLTHGRR